MVIKIYEDKASLGRAAAGQAAVSLRKAIQESGRARIIAATGASQFEVLDALTAMPGIEWPRGEMFDLDEACRRQQVGESWFADLSDVPKRAISMSARQILKSKEILAVVPEARKAQAVKSCFEGEVSPLAPASILRTHAHTTVFLDKH